MFFSLAFHSFHDECYPLHIPQNTDQLSVRSNADSEVEGGGRVHRHDRLCIHTPASLIRCYDDHLVPGALRQTQTALLDVCVQVDGGQGVDVEQTAGVDDGRVTEVLVDLRSTRRMRRRYWLLLDRL